MRWRRKWQPTPVFLPGESQGRGSLVGCCLWGRTESDTTEVTRWWQQHTSVLESFTISLRGHTEVQKPTCPALCLVIPSPPLPHMSGSLDVAIEEQVCAQKKIQSWGGMLLRGFLTCCSLISFLKMKTSGPLQSAFLTAVRQKALLMNSGTSRWLLTSFGYNQSSPQQQPHRDTPSPSDPDSSLPVPEILL